ncbi:ABC transporter ATP-binding protein [Desulfovibrio sp. ZJ369]|uniref:ABC transporter ATP-binding protein n=1 Tax=Desulfovibrio sp. ZJ369 TaxID=2709793 RepID=UPI0013EABF12|nr:ABC transporter ATP-binding protein [Desulfovibrio sp. ZJ369]
MEDLVFSLRGISKRRPGAEGFHLRLTAFDLPRGRLLALAGPSGCGKSTALDLLACVLKPDAPEAATRFVFSPVPEHKTDVLAAWKSGDTDRLASLRLRHLGYVLQTGGLLPFLSARENILLRCKSLGIAEQRREAIADLTARLGITHLLAHFPATLSVGERQRVAVACALAHGPGVVLADEPTAALDPLHARAVLDLFGELAREMGISMIMVTHNADMAQAAGFTVVRVAVQPRAGGIAARIAYAGQD